MQLEINPPGTEAEYLHCLNTCFPGWGGQEMAQWVFRRAIGPDPFPDVLVLRENGRLLAGSAVSYRSVALPNGNLVRAGIMTGSWTLPDARGRGCFSRIIEESVAITRKREGALLLAFVTEENPSCRQLLKAGAASFPTWYLFGPEESEKTMDSVKKPDLRTANETELASVVSLWARQREDKCRLHYLTIEDWKSQFLNRPGQIETVCDESGSFAVIERQSTTDRIHAWWASPQASALLFLQKLAVYARMNNRKLFTFSTDARLAAQCLDAGFQGKPGRLTAMVTDWERLGQALQASALPVGGNHALLNPEGPWFVSKWALQSGDRM